MYISSLVHEKERSYKVAVCIYHHVFMKRKEVIKLRYVYIITCLLKGEKL